MRLKLTLLMKSGQDPAFAFDQDQAEEFRKRVEEAIFPTGTPPKITVFLGNDGMSVTVCTTEIVGYIIEPVKEKPQPE